jgi:hypothetical protein
MNPTLTLSIKQVNCSQSSLLTNSLCERNLSLDQTALLKGRTDGCPNLGVIHAWQFNPGDMVMHLGWGTGQAWAEGYAAITVIVMLARWRQQTHH